MAESELSLPRLREVLIAQQATWTPGSTSMSQLPHSERIRRLGVEPGPDDPPFEELVRRSIARAGQPLPITTARAAPEAFDLTNVEGQNYITSVKDQGSCGSCVAFGCVASIEGSMRFQRKNPDLDVDLSEAHLFYCHGADDGRDCNTGWIPNDALPYCEDPGIADETCFPYIAADQDCSGRCDDWESRVVMISGFRELASRSDMKEWLSTSGPLAACFVVFSDFWSYKSGVYRHVTGEAEGGHCVTIVGYDDADGCWICKNSWGLGWGDRGYFRIGYGECEIDSWQVCGVEGILESNWRNDATIQGLWAPSEERNAWAYLKDLGWRRIDSSSDTVFTNLLVQLGTAKETNSTIDVFISDDIVTQAYLK